MKALVAAVLSLAVALVSSAAAARTVNVVVAENVWSEAVSAVGGANVVIREILSNPAADPHDFEPAPSTARLVADADLVIYNGLGYDAWMDRLLAASRTARQTVINVATLLGRRAGDNPHLWYDPAAMPALVDAVAASLSRTDPDGAPGYAQRAAAYQRELAAIGTRVLAVKARHGSTPVTATEPVFGIMADALGLDMRNRGFQRAVMNETEPSASDIAAMEADLRGGKVRVLFHNAQVSGLLSTYLLALARDGRVPVVAVRETKPAGVTYVQWMLREIDATEAALSAPQG